MVAIHDLRHRFVDAPSSLGARSRARRWDRFLAVFPDLADMTVVDLGGRLEWWRRAPVRPKHVHVVNLESPDGEEPDWGSFTRGDACDLPAAVRERRYDLVFSNSVIEHVGGHAQRVRFADAVNLLAGRHWVQTPYRYFPIEPHVLFPGFQFLPVGARAAVAGRWPLSHTPPTDHRAALRLALGVELLSRSEMAYLFPHSRIESERFARLAKSLLAIKST
jgi:hypothetical protein